MFTMELYLKYLCNSVSGKSKEERTRHLKDEKAKLAQILKSVDSCFCGDNALLDRTDKSIYTYIKKDILQKILANTSRIDAVISESKFYLSELINEIGRLDITSAV